jgi:long-chain acyl-CoA synthetase
MMETRPWLQHYDEGVPPTLQPYPQRTLLDVVSDSARQRPDHPALLFKGAQLSYGELERLSDAFGGALAALGVQKGDRVALLLPNCPQMVIAQLGAWKAGAISAPMNPLYTERELAHGLNECGAETAVVLTPFYDKIKALQPRTGLQRVITTNIKEHLPPLQRVLFTLLIEKKGGHRVTLQGGDLWFADLLRQHVGASGPEVPVGPDDPALLIFTGGTTGAPKAALARHGSLLISAMQLRAWSASVLDEWDDVLLLLMPMFHLYGNVGVLALGLVCHSPLALVPNPSDLDDLVATIRQVQPAFLPGVPTLFIALLEHPDVKSGKVNLDSIKLCISGAAPLMAETKERFERLTGARILEGYALTESMMAAALTPVDGAHKVRSVGLPLPDVEVRIVDADTGQDELGPHEIGEILLRAPQLMEGYWQRPEATAEMLQARHAPDPSQAGAGERWLYTGDLGYLDEEGFLFMVDRKKQVIKPSGFQVWPREVEEVIASHPAVAEVGVAGVPDKRRSEAVKAWVVLREGQEATVDEIRAYCRENLAAYKVPRHVEFRESLPKSTVGKVLRRVLAEEELAGQEQPAGRSKPRRGKGPVGQLREAVSLEGATLASGTGHE